MSTLKVNKIRDNSGSTDAIVLDPSGGAVLAGVTTVSTVKVGSGVTISSDGDVFTTGITTSSSVIVGSGVTISESGIEASGIGITVANINGGAISATRNLIINGAMNVAQYFGKVGATAGNGYYVVDRFKTATASVDEEPTVSQSNVASGSSPYISGLRKAIKFQNGNQTSGAGSGDQICLQYRFEHQDLASSGWDYTSSASSLTLQFWVKSSVAQTYFGRFTSQAGTTKTYPFSFAVTADTWTKVVKTIPGHADLTFTAGSNGNGLLLEFCMYRGTSFTGSVSVDEWHTYNASTRTPDQTSTWYTTNDATFEVTGVQLEVGSQATSFEHRLRVDELAQCQRYFVMFGGDVTAWRLGYIWINSTTNSYLNFSLPVTMRTKPTQTYTTGTASDYQVHAPTSANAAGNTITDCTSVPNIHTQSTKNNVQMVMNTAGSLIAGRMGVFRAANSDAYIGIGAEFS